VRELLRQYPGLLAAAAVVLVGLGVIGLTDVLRFSVRRVLAIASVCFRQSIRRRVLWLTPLVIAGVMIVAQFQRAVDAQDAVRQTTMYCLFATGLLTVLLSVILACTNLPAEIENRVIYTVATKPVTRLEIIVGKTAGFACVSFWVLLIMGAFTLAYLHWQDWSLRRVISRNLETNMVDEVSVPTLTYYRDRGTLHARQLGLPERLDILSRMPADDEDRWVAGGGDGEIMIRFRIDRSAVPPPDPAEAEELGPLPDGARRRWPGGLALVLDVEARRTGNGNPSTAPATAPAAASIGIDLRNGRLESVVSSVALGYFDIALPAERVPLLLYIPQEHLERWIPASAGATDVYVVVTTGASGYEYTLRRAGTFMQVPGRKFEPVDIIYGGRLGWQLRGGSGAGGRLAIYRFRGHSMPRGAATYSFELRSQLEADYWETLEEAPIMRVVCDIRNRRTGYVARGIEVFPESNRPAYFDVPAAAVDDGTGRADFDVIVRMTSNGWITLRGGSNASLKLIIRDQSFAWNIFKSLLILWLLSLLVIVISILSSTFLSWPIAVVLTLVILGGRWCAQQLGDLTDPGIGRAIVNDMFRGSTAATSRAVSESVDALVAALRIVSAVLPDISVFAAIDAPQRGVAISAQTMIEALGVAAFFGLPLLVLSYVFLKYKEVAP